MCVCVCVWMRGKYCVLCVKQLMARFTTNGKPLDGLHVFDLVQCVNAPIITYYYMQIKPQ